MLSPGIIAAATGGGGPAPYHADAVHFDGSAWLSIANLIAASPRNFAMSIWVKMASLDDNPFSPLLVVSPEVLYDPLIAIEAGTGTTNQFYYDCAPIPGALKGYSNDNTIVAVQWMNLKISANSDHPVNEKIVQLYLGDVDVLGDVVDAGDAFDMVFTGLPLFLFSDSVGSNFVGDAADTWIAPGQFIDFSVEANRRKFIDVNGKPVDLGADGSTPTGTAPPMFFSGNAAGFPTNKGTGGVFTLTGSLTNASTSPSD